MKYYTVGKIVNTHGIRGELKVVPSTDFPKERFKKGSLLYAFKEETAQSVGLMVESAREHKGTILVKFADLPSINDVEKYKGWTLKVAEADLNANELEDGEYYYHQIIGLSVKTVAGEEIGRIKEILSPGANDVWVVSRPGESDLLLPVIKQVVKQVDLPQKQVVVELMEGLD
ncbi:ribosome maturation factor RimM [Levilactobacillus bambusae]|uniref:Ribosome maturation factor RimM n=1 Tax=Levilactobacillus bambusae TaxID=2024736 RepID=A0A2V1N4S1_9LACO|nr:ribosome maturation factor RimM [Levilactobacillus bambusae]PWG00895.1 ribosome maturation factor RimM [Levilactobacillus bambusae]